MSSSTTPSDRSSYPLPERPCLRPLEAFPDPKGRLVLRDPTQLARGYLAAAAEEVELLALMDGSRSHLQIRQEFTRRTGKLVPVDRYERMVAELNACGYFWGEGFELYYAEQHRRYLAAPCRPLRAPDGFGVPAAGLAGYLARIVRASEPPPLPAGRLVGLIVPHLDYPRGERCYGLGYAVAVERARPQRVVILGTNHFGRSLGVVATRQAFETPDGVLETDREFLDRLEAACGGNLFPYELDHLAEHSIELQAVWLAHLFGTGVRIVPLLCPDPAGPPPEPGGVAPTALAAALRELLARDPTPTLLIASADLSHMGRSFDPKDPPLGPALYERVRQEDEAALEVLEAGDAEGFRRGLERTGNPTRICSVGCLYTLAAAVPEGTTATRLAYHQAATPRAQNLVTCCAFAYTAAD